MPKNEKINNVKLRLITNPKKKQMKSKKTGIRIRTITNMTNFLNHLSGKSWKPQQIILLSRENSIRSNFLSYASQLNYCKKEGELYYFLDRLFDPFHAKQIIELSNKYNIEVMDKKRLRLEQENNETDNIHNEINLAEMYNKLQLRLGELEVENLMLKNKIISADAEINKLNNRRNTESYEIEINLLKDKIVNFQNLLTAYFN